jgi:hypothetical protein
VVYVTYPIEVVLVLKLVSIEESKDTHTLCPVFQKIIHFRRTAPRSSYETYKLGWFSDKPGKDPMETPPH